MEEKKLYNAVQKFITLADGREIMIETGKLAKQADGSVVVKQGDTMLLATVVAAKDAKPDTDFMPLQVEYKEKYAACGRYPGGFMKREGKANDSEVLVARLIDRALRPLFPVDYHAEVYVNGQPHLRRWRRTSSPTRWPDWPPRPHWPSRTSPSAARFQRGARGARRRRVLSSTRPSRSMPERADLDIMVAAARSTTS